MAEQLQHLIDRIRQEGVENGEKTAEALIADAKTKAAAIVAEAQKKAQEATAKAEADAKAFAERGRQTLQQAARDLLISIGGSVGRVVSGVVDAKVGAALTPETVGQMLVKLAASYGSAENLTVALGEADAAALKGGVSKEVNDMLAKGLQIESDREIFKGFRLGTKGGQVFHDFTKEAIAESLANFLRPDLADVVKKAAKE